ncbi:hypothetical protein B0H10DRAFT_2038553 [Mycena sp. CBHHK59/15]|nr:hypothetical protein B0H10DRAFT_2038553 [Mycena sp. CBHHK59/15]
MCSETAPAADSIISFLCKCLSKSADLAMIHMPSPTILRSFSPSHIKSAALMERFPSASNARHKQRCSNVGCRIRCAHHLLPYCVRRAGIRHHGGPRVALPPRDPARDSVPSTAIPCHRARLYARCELHAMPAHINRACHGIAARRSGSDDNLCAGGVPRHRGLRRRVPDHGKGCSAGTCRSRGSHVWCGEHGQEASARADGCPPSLRGARIGACWTTVPHEHPLTTATGTRSRYGAVNPRPSCFSGTLLFWG